MVSERDLVTKLAKYIISREAYPEIPPSLDGEILLEEDRTEDGRLRGVISVSVEAFLDLPDVANPGKKRRDRPRFTYEEMVACDPEDTQGYKKYLDKWRAEGLI